MTIRTLLVAKGDGVHHCFLCRFCLCRCCLSVCVDAVFLTPALLLSVCVSARHKGGRSGPDWTKLDQSGPNCFFLSPPISVLPPLFSVLVLAIANTLSSNGRTNTQHAHGSVAPTTACANHLLCRLCVFPVSPPTSVLPPLFYVLVLGACCPHRHSGPSQGSCTAGCTVVMTRRGTGIYIGYLTGYPPLPTTAPKG